MYTTLVCFLLYFFCIPSPSNSIDAVAHCSSGKKEKKEKSYKILMMLIIAMYVNQTIRVSIEWYLSWFAYINDNGSSEAVATFAQTKETPLRVLYLVAATILLDIIKLGIADSIMVLLS
jgi:hypothetical protein